MLTLLQILAFPKKKSFASAKPTFPIRAPYSGPFHFGPLGFFLWNVVFSLKDPK